MFTLQVLRRRVLAAGVGVCAAAGAGAQTLQSNITTANVSLALSAIGVTPLNPGPNPLASVMLTWSPRAGATGYRIQRQAPTQVSGTWVYSPWVTISASLPATTTNYTASGLVPGVPLHFRVLSSLSTGATDTSAAASVTTPGMVTPTDTVPPSNIATAWPWPPPSSYGYAIMLVHECFAQGYSVAAMWARNPAATRYRLYALPAKSTQGGVSKLVYDTIGSVDNLRTLNYGLAGRPEFMVPNWPGPNERYYQPGMWVYIGSVGVPADAIIPTRCGR